MSETTDQEIVRACNQQDATKRTEGSLYAKPSAGGHRGLIFSEENGGTVAVTYDPKDAEFIVRACNNHDALVGALRGVLAHAEDMTCELHQTDDLSEYPYIQRARAALAKAKGESS